MTESQNTDGLDMSILAPAFLAGVIVLLTHIPLGREVIKRGIIFIDLAIAQIAGLGVIIAFQFGWELHGIEAQLAAVTSALLGAWLLHFMEKKAGEHLEAFIGVSFVLAATASVLLLANNPHGGEHLKELLVGQILWVDWPQVSIRSDSVYNRGHHLVQVQKQDRRYRFLCPVCGFHHILSAADRCLPGVHQSDHPGAGSIKYAEKPGLILAFIVGVSGYLSGLMVSAFFDLPSGAVIVWCLAVSALLIPVLLSKLFNTSVKQS